MYSHRDALAATANGPFAVAWTSDGGGSGDPEFWRTALHALQPGDSHGLAPQDPHVSVGPSRFRVSSPLRVVCDGRRVQTSLKENLPAVSLPMSRLDPFELLTLRMCIHR